MNAAVHATYDTQERGRDKEKRVYKKITIEDKTFYNKNKLLAIPKEKSATLAILFFINVEQNSIYQLNRVKEINKNALNKLLKKETTFWAMKNYTAANYQLVIRFSNAYTSCRSMKNRGKVRKRREKCTGIRRKQTKIMERSSWKSKRDAKRGIQKKYNEKNVCICPVHFFSTHPILLTRTIWFICFLCYIRRRLKRRSCDFWFWFQSNSENSQRANMLGNKNHGSAWIQ